MRRFNLKFIALLIVLMPMVALGADVPILDNLTFVEDAYNSALSATQNVCKTLISKSYSSISSIFNNVISVLLALIACIWLFKHLKTGTISREELFKALIWVITFVIVYVLLNSRAAFDEFIQMFFIPQHLANSALTTGGGNVANQLNQAFIMPYKTYFAAQEAGYNEIVEFLGIILKELGIGPLIAFFGSRIGLFVYTFYILFLMVLIIAIIIIHLYSTFLSFIYMTFLPIMIPLLLIPQTKSIFFAWVKSFIGITMYVPLSMIPVSIITKINSLMTSNGESIWQNTMYYSFLGLVFVVISFLILYKIPTWISELLGVANQGVGAGGVMGMMKAAGMGVGAAAMSAGKSLGKSFSNLGSNSSGLSKAASIANIASLGAGGAISGLAGLAKNGFKSLGKHFSGKNLNKE